jgi:glutathione S-transferase
VCNKCKLTNPRYLCETYDKEGKMLPKGIKDRIRVLQWVHASEATFALHGLAILYVRWNMPKDAAKGTLEAAEKGMSVNVQNDMAWLENELAQSPGKFLIGDHPTAADIMMHFSIDFMLVRQLGTQGKEWPNIMKWKKACEETEGYKQAIAKTGHKL